MKHICLIGSVVALALASGCASSRQSRTEAPDGLYFKTDGTGGSYPMTMFPPNGGPPAKVELQEYAGFIPQRALVVKRSEAFFVQLTGQGAGGWTNTGIFLVADHVPYDWQLRKSPAKPPAAGQPQGSPATLVLLAGSRKEADKVATAMRKRYSLPLEAEPPRDTK